MSKITKKWAQTRDYTEARDFSNFYGIFEYQNLFNKVKINEDHCVHRHRRLIIFNSEQ